MNSYVVLSMWRLLRASSAQSGRQHWQVAIQLLSVKFGLECFAPRLPQRPGALMVLERCSATGRLSWRAAPDWSHQSHHWSAGHGAPRTPSLSGPPAATPGAAAPRRAQKAYLKAKARRPLDTTKEGFLRRARISEPTAARYESAVQELEKWAGKNGWPLHEHDLADVAIEKYMEHLYHQNAAPWKGRNLLHGFIWTRRLPKARTTLPLSRESLAGWAKVDPEFQRDPAVWEAILAMAVWSAAHLGEEGVQSGRAMIIGFDGYFRPSELLNVQRDHVVPPVQGAPSKAWGILIAPQPSRRRGTSTTSAPPPQRSKGGNYDETVLIGDTPSIQAGRRIAAQCLAKAYAEAAPGGRIVKLRDLVHFEKLFAKASAACFFDDLRMTPHSLRHGGPSMDRFGNWRDLREIQKRGRWAASQSVRRYEKAGTLLRQMNKLTTGLVGCGGKLCSRLTQLLRL